MLTSILRKEKKQLQYIQNLRKNKNSEDIDDEWSSGQNDDAFDIFAAGTEFWFFRCENTR